MQLFSDKINVSVRYFAVCAKCDKRTGDCLTAVEMRASNSVDGWRCIMGENWCKKCLGKAAVEKGNRLRALAAKHK